MNKFNLKESFNDLHFVEETHTYTIKDKKYPSVSGLIKSFYEEFDAKRIAPFSAKKAGITVAQQLKDWEDNRDQAAQVGTDFHDWAEQYAIRHVGPNKTRDTAYLQPNDHMQTNCISFWKQLDPKYEVAALELRMYHKDFNYAGTADIILRNTETGNYVIADYKTNKDLFKNYKGKTMKMPFAALLDCPQSKYELQLSYYQMMLEGTGAKVEERWVVYVRPEDGYKIYKTDDHTLTLAEYHEHKELYDWLK